MASVHCPCALQSCCVLPLHLVSPGKVQVSVDDPAGARLQVLLAVTEDGLSSNVRGGENGGRTLNHNAVVRDLHRVGTTSGGKFDKTVNLPIKSDWKNENVRVIALAQDPNTGAILGAAELPFAAPATPATGR